MLFDAETRETHLLIRPRQRRLDAAIAPEFRDEVVRLVDGGARRLVIDLSEVDFLDSSGLGALVAILKRLGTAGALEITGLNRPVRKVFELTRMVEVFTIRETGSAAAGRAP